MFVIWCHIWLDDVIENGMWLVNTLGNDPLGVMESLNDQYNDKNGNFKNIYLKIWQKSITYWYARSNKSWVSN